MFRLDSFGFAKDKRLLKNVVIYGFSNGVTAFAPLLLLPILTRALSPSDFGYYTMFLMVYAIATIFMGLNQHGAVSVNYVKMDERSFPDFVGSALVLPMALFVVLVVLLKTSLMDGVLATTHQNKTMTFLALLSAFFNVFLLSSLTTFQASNNAVKFMLVKGVQSFMDIFGTILLVLVFAMGLYGRILSFSSAILAASIIGILLIRRLGFLNLKFDKRYVWRALVFGVPLVPHALSGVSLMYVDRFVLAKVLDLNAVGLYMAALQVAMSLLLIIEPVNKAFAPWLFKKLTCITPEEKKQIVNMSYVYFFVLVVLALVGAALAFMLFGFLVGKDYQTAKPLLPALFGGFAFQGMYYTVTNYILFSERTGLMSSISVTSVVLGGILSFQLVSKIGVLGASISFMLTNMMMFVFVWYFANKSMPMPWFGRDVPKLNKYDNYGSR